MGTGAAAFAGEPRYTLYIVPPVLRGLSPFDVPHAHAALYVRYFSIGFVDTDGMRHSECMVENQHAFGRGRRCDRRLVAYSVLFMFNPVWWLCVTVLISGAVGTARMLLRQHSLAQVVAGTSWEWFAVLPV